MQTGKLNERVTITQPTESSRGSMGSSVTTFETHATVWAEITQLRGDEAQRLATQEATASFRVRIRRLTTVTTAMQITWGSKTLRINSVEQLRTEGLTVILATERLTP